MKKTGIACFIIFFLWACGPQAEEQPVSPAEIAQNSDGKKLFMARCASCHMVNRELSGPALKGVTSRWPDAQKLYAFIRNSEEMVGSDAYSRQLWLKYNQTIMPAQPDLSDAQIKSILDYIESAP